MGTEGSDDFGRNLDLSPVPSYVWERRESDFVFVSFNRAALARTNDGLLERSRGSVAAGGHRRAMLTCLETGGVVRKVSHGSRWGGPVTRSWLTYSSPAPDVVVVQAEEDAATPPLGQPGDERRFLGQLLENLPGMAYRCWNDTDWTMQFVSEGAFELTGYRPRELVGSQEASFGDLIHPDDRDRVWSTVQEGLEAHDRFDITYRILTREGQQRWVWEQGSGVWSTDGTLEAIEGFITDITDRQDLVLELDRAEGRYRTLVEQSLAGVYLIEGGRFAFVNARFAEIFGYAVEEVLATESILDLVSPADRELVRENIRRRVMGEVGELHYEFRGLRKDGAEIDVEVHGRTVPGGDGTVVLGTLLDVTERKRMSARYHRAQKMEALGRLAGGVAHDFNNVLTVIHSIADLLKAECAGEPGFSADLDELISAADRGAALSRQLLAFSRPKPERVNPVSLSDAVEEMLPMLERLTGSGVRIEADIVPGLPAVEVDPSHLEQVMMNLVLNARDAMEAGGLCTVRTRLRRPDEGGAGEVVLEVSDTGAGIPEEYRDRIFEPFFTTKGDRGTGLGLGNVWSIAEQYGGSVELESEVGRGTTFRVSLPVPG